jgi:hypothetical protein
MRLTPRYVSPLHQKPLWKSWCQSITKVLLGLEEDANDCFNGVISGTTNLMLLLSGTIELPMTLGDAIVDLSDGENDGRYEVAMSSDMKGTVRYFLHAHFRVSELNPCSIGSAYVEHIQNFLYDLCAHVMARHEFLGTGGVNRASIVKTSEKLRRATRLTCRVVDAFKHLLPPCGRWMATWSEWHAMSYILEMTDGTFLTKDFSNRSQFNSMVFVDEVICNVLREHNERGDNIIASLANLKTPFGWCACSDAFRLLGKIASDSDAIAKLLPNLAEFTETVVNGLAAGKRLSSPATPKRELSEDAGLTEGTSDEQPKPKRLKF